jgi:hypothetical protein
MKTQDTRSGPLRSLKEHIKRAMRATPPRRYPKREDRLALKAGELVEVRSKEEILATLDQRGCLENLPFMPEMLQYCGRRLKVFKRADKTCDNIQSWSIRRIRNTVHLQSIRCDGGDHGGCEAGCLIFWKEAWLKRASSEVVGTETIVLSPGRSLANCGRLSVESLVDVSHIDNLEGESVYFCQATEVLRFSSRMAWWDPRQYFRDLRSGNLDSGLAGDSRAEKALELLLAVFKVLRAIAIPIFNRMQSKLDGRPYPIIAGTVGRTPVDVLDLRPGELVQVRGKEEIFATLDKNHRNRGLLFDSEMLSYCGGIYRVLRRVHHIIDEKTGKMMNMKYPCIVLESVFCQSDYHRLCPRAIFSYWRENWLRRVDSREIPISLPDQEGSVGLGNSSQPLDVRRGTCDVREVPAGQQGLR